MKCLVVDDSRVVRKVARRILEDLSFECDEAEDGDVAYDYCQKNMPDAVLLDWNMPNLSGIEFLEKLRALPNGNKPKVVFCTTENEFPYIQEALDKGADEYIMKPFDHDIIETKFQQVGLISV